VEESVFLPKMVDNYLSKYFIAPIIRNPDYRNVNNNLKALVYAFDLDLPA